MAIRTLVHIAKQPKAPPAARVSAAEALLNRGWGKPPQDLNLNHQGEAFNALIEALDGISRDLPAANGHDTANGKANGHGS